MHSVQSLSADSNSLAPHYSAFHVAQRLLLSGHSHQAWPDVARAAQLEAFDDAAELVDAKWSRAFEKAELVRQGFRRLLGDPQAEIALTSNTHDAVVRFLSALPLTTKPELITTDAEFFTLQRQLARLSEEGIRVQRLLARPVSTLVERMISALELGSHRTAAVLISSVLFDGAEIVPELAALARKCEQLGVPLFIDAYHHLNVVPFSVSEAGLERAFITGGGYKYCELGEGNCFLRIPKGCLLRPAVTGWFAEFEELDAQRLGLDKVGYAPDFRRFAGSTYDPTSHYRAARVFEFFLQQELDVSLLRAVSQQQVGRLRAKFDTLGIDPKLMDYDRSLELRQVGGFLAFSTPRASELVVALKHRNVDCDARGRVLRLGPAPYLSDAQLDNAIDALGEAVRALD